MTPTPPGTKGLKLRNPMQIAFDNPRSLRKAVDALCWDCSGQTKVEVRKCVVEDCPLWSHRPYTKKGS